MALSENKHEVSIFQADEGYQIQCICGWNHFATRADKTKLHPDRDPDCFAVAITERHYVSQGIWPYTIHGKPEKSIEGQIVILHDWPFNKE